VHRSVASDDDQQLGAFVGSAARQLGQLAGRARKERISS
jgi:hypothetical protein